ncbi:MAG: cell division protein ZapA [Alteromonadaceae bacterium]|uniref:cell division protein ZapA n=1 Tax=unclassified Marinobacter TaxID=83889 RepID=UPI000C58E492|nr:cell division protein ZapA [Marinobacter sp. BGYM27]MAA67142.1 cell division protein ZapA [Alteromonadaceae bacterium]MBH87033.1 cell division protein ZapA [Alteromonadaceae bacterium]MDG5500897.1 cell division protein ZapA [Marinobacter sp. BGYM27]|tara:strand:- start:33312 stop:33608 length:297 start_codon:yes stop_codon:yes gene_type:complete
MPEKPTTVEVNILDKSYLVACPDEARSALQESARHLDSKMREIRASGKVFGTERIAVMAALNITHDLLEQSTVSDGASSVLRRMDSRLDDVLNKKSGS